MTMCILCLANQTSRNSPIKSHWCFFQLVEQSNGRDAFFKKNREASPLSERATRFLSRRHRGRESRGRFHVLHKQKESLRENETHVRAVDRVPTSRARAHKKMDRCAPRRVIDSASSSMPTTVFCFVVALPRSREVLTAKRALTQLVACDGFAVYSNESFVVGRGVRSEVAVEDSMSVPLKATEFGPVAATNTKVLRKVWAHVADTCIHRRFDWIVKIDADTVFFTNRLRARLDSVRTRAHTPALLTNPCCEREETTSKPRYLTDTRCRDKRDATIYFEKGCVYGGMYIASGPAVEALANDARLGEKGACAERTRQAIAGTGAAEDGWFHMCLTKDLGVAQIQVDGIIEAGSPQRCELSGIDDANAMVAYHDFKTVKRYDACFKRANANANAQNFLSHIVLLTLMITLALRLKKQMSTRVVAKRRKSLSSLLCGG